MKENVADLKLTFTIDTNYCVKIKYWRGIHIFSSFVSLIFFVIICKLNYSGQIKFPVKMTNLHFNVNKWKALFLKKKNWIISHVEVFFFFFCVDSADSSPSKSITQEPTHHTSSNKSGNNQGPTNSSFNNKSAQQGPNKNASNITILQKKEGQKSKSPAKGEGRSPHRRSHRTPSPTKQTPRGNERGKENRPSECLNTSNDFFWLMLFLK